MKKRFVSAALAAVMALSMTACGSSNSAAETTAADTEAAESQAEETTAEEAKTTDGGTLIVGFDQNKGDTKLVFQTDQLVLHILTEL